MSIFVSDIDLTTNVAAISNQISVDLGPLLGAFMFTLVLKVERGDIKFDLV